MNWWICLCILFQPQSASLDVMVPPDIDNEKSSEDIILKTGSNAKLECQANGYPKPTISWIRDKTFYTPKGKDGNMIKAKDPDTGLIRLCAYNYRVLMIFFHTELKKNSYNEFYNTEIFSFLFSRNIRWTNPYNSESYPRWFWCLSLHSQKWSTPCIQQTSCS